VYEGGASLFPDCYSFAPGSLLSIIPAFTGIAGIVLRLCYEENSSPNIFMGLRNIAKDPFFVWFPS
jgi:hypothetical protein